MTADITSNDLNNNTLEGIDLQTDTAASLSARADANIVDANGGLADVAANTLGNSNICLELTNNGNPNVNATFQVQNNGTGLFQFFEQGNDSLANQIGAITPVAQGTCP